MTTPSPCAICEKHKNLREFVIFENRELIVSHLPPSPEQLHVYLGYCFIEPKAHLTQIWELSEENMQQMGSWIRRLSLAQRQLLNAEKTYFLKFADLTPHFHVHVFPRHPQTPKTVIGDAVRFWQDGPKGNETRVKQLCLQMQDFFIEDLS